MPPIDDEERIRLESVAVLDRRIVKRNNRPVKCWSNGPILFMKMPLGKIYSGCNNSFHGFSLEDKAVSRGGIVHNVSFLYKE